MFKNDGLRTVAPEKDMELSSAGGGSGNVKTSIIHRLGNKNDVLSGPFNWTIYSRDLEPEEIASHEEDKTKLCAITVIGPRRKWSDLLMPGFGKRDSIFIISEALRVWPEIQGASFKKNSSIKLLFTQDIEDWLERN